MKAKTLLLVLASLLPASLSTAALSQTVVTTTRDVRHFVTCEDGVYAVYPALVIAPDGKRKIIYPNPCPRARKGKGKWRKSKRHQPKPRR